MGLSRQEHESGLPFPSPGDLPDRGIELMSLASPALAGRFFTTAPLSDFGLQYKQSRSVQHCLVAQFCQTLWGPMD